MTIPSPMIVQKIANQRFLD